MLKPTVKTLETSQAILKLFQKLDITEQEAMVSVFYLLECWADKLSIRERKSLYAMTVLLQGSINSHELHSRGKRK